MLTFNKSSGYLLAAKLRKVESKTKEFILSFAETE